MRLITDIFAFCAQRGAALEHDLGQRLSHPRGGRDGAAGAGVHAARRHRVRAVGRRRRPRRGRLRAAHLLLLQRAQRLLRGDREVPRGAQDLGRGDARPVRREERAVAASSASTRQTAGVSLTAQQPYNNVVRTALQALSAVLGGTQSLHTNSLDEALALPTSEAVTLALRTQQIIAHESGVANVVDPLGGSYFVEKLTQDMEREALAILPDDRRAWAAWWRRSSSGYPQKEIAESVVPLPAGGRAAREDHRRRQRLRRGERGAGPDPLHRRGRGASGSWPSSSGCGANATTAGCERALDGLRDGGGRTREHDELRSSKRFAPTRRSARCATRCARCGASTKKCRWSRQPTAASRQRITRAP